MNDSNQFERIQATLRAFRTDRGWEMNPKNVTMALNLESAELLELFQWLTPEESATFGDHLPRQQVEEEMADVLIYLLNLAERLDVDLLTAAERKIETNARKYPARSGRKLEELEAVRNIALPVHDLLAITTERPSPSDGGAFSDWLLSQLYSPLLGL